MTTANGGVVTLEKKPTRARSSIAFRLGIWFSSCAFLLIVSVVCYLYWSLEGTLEFQTGQVLADRVQTLRALYLSNPNDISAIKHRVEWEWPQRKIERIYVRVIETDGGLLTETPAMDTETIRVLEALRKRSLQNPHTGWDSYRSLTNDSGFHTQIFKIEMPGHPEASILVETALDCRDSTLLLNQYRSRIYYALLFSIVLCGILGWQIGKRGISTIRQISLIAEKINSSNLHERITTSVLPIELASLGETFNAMLNRLENAFERLSRFSADIAHELRTPIYNLSGEIEVALGKMRAPQYYQNTLGSCLEETKKVSRIIDALLFLASCENPKVELKRERVELKKELELVAEFYEASVAEAGLRFSVEVPDGIFVSIERTLFQRALGNLITNSIRHTPKGGEIKILVQEEASQVLIEVSDSGIGIPREHLKRVFERFYRVDESRSKVSGGTGLGLAIVKSIASIHGGSVRIDSLENQGTQVQLFLPLQPLLA